MLANFRSEGNLPPLFVGGWFYDGCPGEICSGGDIKQSDTCFFQCYCGFDRLINGDAGSDPYAIQEFTAGQTYRDRIVEAALFLNICNFYDC